MADSVYRKTPLPARLNLNDRNTRQQLLTGVSPEDNRRGTLDGVGPAGSSSAAQSQKNCNDVMRQDLRDWLGDHGINGPPPSMEAEQRAMWQWIRDFHKEYNDDWFARNMPRVLEKFRPVFNDEMKRMKAEHAAAAPPPSAPAAGGADLLDFDGPANAPTPPAAPASAPGTDLLALDGAAPTSAQAPAYSAAPAPAPAPEGGLDSLLMPISAPAEAPAQPTPAIQLGSAAGQGGAADLLGLF